MFNVVAAIVMMNIIFTIIIAIVYIIGNNIVVKSVNVVVDIWIDCVTDVMMMKVVVVVVVRWSNGGSRLKMAHIQR